MYVGILISSDIGRSQKHDCNEAAWSKHYFLQPRKLVGKYFFSFKLSCQHYQGTSNQVITSLLLK